VLALLNPTAAKGKAGVAPKAGKKKVDQVLGNGGKKRSGRLVFVVFRLKFPNV
jgi:hypothetical protein